MSKKRYILKKRAIREMRDSEAIDDSGDRYSHKMAWAGDRDKRFGQFLIYPTVAPKSNSPNSTDPKDWKTQSLKEAKKKGEVIIVWRKKKAKKLAAGSWKKGKDKKEAMDKYKKRVKNEKNKS